MAKSLPVSCRIPNEWLLNIREAMPQLANKSNGELARIGVIVLMGYDINTAINAAMSDGGTRIPAEIEIAA